MQNQTEYEEYVKISRICFRILRAWKGLLITAILGALLGGAYSGFKQFRAMKSAGDPTVTESSIQKNKVYQYLSNELMIEALVNKQQNSTLMLIDSNDAWNGSIQYSLTAKNPEVFSTMDFFNTMLEDEKLYNELVTLVSNGENNRIPDNVIVTCAMPDNQPWYFDDNTRLSVALDVAIYTNDADLCSKMMNIVCEFVDEKVIELQKNYFTLSAVNTRKSMYKGYAVAVSDKIEKQNTLFNNAVKNETDQIAKLNYTDKLYIEQNYPQYRNWTSVASSGASLSLKSVLKFAILGGVGLFIVYAVLVALCYLLSGTIREEDDLNDVFGLSLIGNLNEKIFKKGVSAWLERIIARFTVPYQSKAFVETALNEMEGEKILIAGGEDEAVTGIVRKMTEGNKQVQMVNHLFDEATIRRIAANADGVILLVQIGKTTRIQLKREMEIAKELGLKILGVVTAR